MLGATDVGGAELTTVATLMAFHTNKAMSNSKLSDEEFDATLKQISQMLEYYAVRLPSSHCSQQQRLGSVRACVRACERAA